MTIIGMTTEHLFTAKLHKYFAIEDCHVRSFVQWKSSDVHLGKLLPIDNAHVVSAANWNMCVRRVLSFGTFATAPHKFISTIWSYSKLRVDFHCFFFIRSSCRLVGLIHGYCSFMAFTFITEYNEDDDDDYDGRRRWQKAHWMVCVRLSEFIPLSLWPSSLEHDDDQNHVRYETWHKVRISLFPYSSDDWFFFRRVSVWSQFVAQSHRLLFFSVARCVLKSILIKCFFLFFFWISMRIDDSARTTIIE